MSATPFDSILFDAAIDLSPKGPNQRSLLLMRLLKADVNAISDGELLEVLLSSIPTVTDAHALAMRLLERFGNLNGVMFADDVALSAIPEVNDIVLYELAAMRLTAQRMSKTEVTNRPIIQSWSALMEYCRLTMGHSRVEEFRVLFLNQAYVLIADEVMQRGTTNHTPAYPREIIRRTLELSAAAILLVHNHPSGDLTPSKSDIDITLKIMEAAATVNVTVHDHVIITDTGHLSLKSHHYLPEVPTVTAKPVSPQEQMSLF